MRLAATLLIAICALAAGCASLTSRTRDRDRNDTPAVERGGNSREWWLEGSETAKGKTKQVPADLARTDRDGIIAGVLVDSREGKPLKGVTYVQVRTAEDVTPAGGSKRGLSFETDADGYFFVPGLRPGQTYILSVVREVDGVKIAGEAQVKPPAGNIRIEMSEDRVSSTTPPLPPPPGMGPYEPSNAATLRPPPLPPTPGGDLPPIPGRENIAGTPSLPPIAAIRPPPAAATPGTPFHTEDDLPPAPPAPPVPRAPAQRVPNFIVSDMIGADWEFRYADGRLILMEFWSTTCIPCAKAIPGIKRLQDDYGKSGLEIVAVACEPEGGFHSRARDVAEVARRKELNYKTYLERDGHVGEVQKLFKVEWIPTLVLLDRQGNVLWRGGAAEMDLLRLEEVVKPYLTKR